MVADPSPERSLEHLAASQYGVVSREQVLEAGLSRHVIQGKLKRGSWVRVLPSVYRVAGVSVSWMQKVVAAFLWANSGVVSHSTAGCLLNLEVATCERVHLWIPRYRNCPAPWVSLHIGSIPSKETALSGPVRITRPARTLVDMGSELGEEELEAAVEDALRRRLVTVEALEQYLASTSRRGRPGVRQLRRVLRLRGEAGRPLDSLFEIRLRRLIRKARFPQPVGQYPIAHGDKEYRLDFAYPERKLAIEADSYRHHSGRAVFESDRERLSILASLGWRVLHVTWRQLVEEPDKVLDRIARALV
jgi:very-short-patch-repair endonuclease